jgi:hypothetical protein
MADSTKEQQAAKLVDKFKQAVLEMAEARFRHNSLPDQETEQELRYKHGRVAKLRGTLFKAVCNTTVSL